VHNADHLSFVVKDISSGGKVSSTNDGLGNNTSSGTRSFGASSSLSNIVTGSVGFNHKEPVSIHTLIENRRSGSTAD